MPYATPAELQNVLDLGTLAQLSAESGTAPDDAVLANVLADASDLMDSYLGGRYVVPVTAPSAVARLRPWCLSIAKWLLLERRLAGRYDQGAQFAFERALEWLRDVAGSEASLADATPVSQASPSTAGGRGGSDAAVFRGGLSL